MFQAGLQMCSVIPNFLEDPIGTIRRVGEIGFKYIETADMLFDPSKVSLDALAQAYRDAEMVHCGKHFFPFVGHDADYQMRLLEQFGGDQLVLAADFFTCRTDVIVRCEEYNRLGRLLKKNGFHFLYHNHAHELQVFEGQTVLDIIAENTDPEYVNFELDMYWVFRGGANPVNTLKKYGKRVKNIHIKDANPHYKGHMNFFDDFGYDTVMTSDWNDIHNTSLCVTDIGDGLLDIASIAEAAEKYTDAKVAFIELDRSDFDNVDKVRAIEHNMENIRKIDGLKI